jgi:hypothetical protein
LVPPFDVAEEADGSESFGVHAANKVIKNEIQIIRAIILLFICFHPSRQVK